MQLDSSPPKARRALVPLLAALSLLASVAMLGSARAETAARQTTPTLGHVFVLMGENQGLDKLTLKHAPYLVGSLKPRSAWLTDYRGVTLGGSLANYLGMTSGRFKKCDLNDDLPDHCRFKGDNLFHQLDAAGMTWRSWMESMPHPCDFIDSGVAWWSDIYTVHHNPAMYYTNVQGGVYDEGITPRRECLKSVLPMGSTQPNDTRAFDRALAKGDVGRFNLVVPNDCENGHDACPAKADSVRQFDRFLAREVPKITHSPAFGRDGVIIITYDSGLSPKHKQILFAAIGPKIKPGIYTDGPYTHYSLLRTLEDGFNLPRHLGNAASAKPLAAIWR